MAGGAVKAAVGGLVMDPDVAPTLLQSIHRSAARVLTWAGPGVAHLYTADCTHIARGYTSN